jgi:hypothetical protein
VGNTSYRTENSTTEYVNDELLKQKEDAVLDSLQSNADRLRAALFEFESIEDDDAASSGSCLNVNGPCSPLSTSKGSASRFAVGDDRAQGESLSRAAQSLCSVSQRASLNKQQTSNFTLLPLRSITILVAAVVLLSFPAGASNFFFEDSVVLINCCTAMLVGGLGGDPNNVRIEVVGWISALLVLVGLNVSAAASAVTLYHHCAARNVYREP